MTVRFRVASITSNTGDKLTLPSSGLICIVGGNNVGKSQLLRDISHSATEITYAPVVLSNIDYSRSGSEKDLVDWLRRNAVATDVFPGKEPEWKPASGGKSEREQYLRLSWGRSGMSDSSSWSKFLIWFSSAGRLAAAAAGNGRGGTGPYDSPDSPLVGRLMRAGAEEEELSQLAADSFDMPLVLDRLSDGLRLRVGDPGIDVPPLNRPTVEYEQAVAALPLLANQGDGIKSFIGLALTVIASTQQLLVVDEPEAFLHPAQARSLGRWLPRQANERDKQIILATHDRDVVLGLLDSGQPVTVIRVSRSGNKNTIRALAPADVENVWADPVLRYSNTLQGLFYEQVVICESDADCRFYSAVLDSQAVTKERRSMADGTLFVPSGGKQRAGILARSLTSLGVDVASFPDFDVLREIGDIRNLVEGSGGVWSADIDQPYKTLTSWVNQQPDGWKRAKNQGLSSLKEGTIYKTGERLLAILASQGVHIVPCGEMEGLDRSIGQHGSGWVSDMLAKNGHKHCQEAHRLVASLLHVSFEDAQIEKITPKSNGAHTPAAMEQTSAVAPGPLAKDEQGATRRSLSVIQRLRALRGASGN